MAIQTQVLLNFTTHAARVTVTDTAIQVFKHSQFNCDFDSFDLQDQLEASDYVIAPLPDSYLCVEVMGDC
jgi:hypothetical protein